MSLEFKHLLARDAQLPSRIREAIVMGDVHEAGRMLMKDYGLDCVEVSLLLDAPLCGPRACGASR